MESTKFKYRKLEPKDESEIAYLVAKVFAMNEPLAVAQNMTLEEFLQFSQAYIKKVIADDISVVAQDVSTGELIAFSIAEDLYSDTQPDIPVLSPKFGPIFLLLDYLCDRFKEKHPKTAGYNILHIFMIGVDSQHRHLGITSDLVALNLRLAKDRGYSLACTEATGPHSQRIFRKLEFVTLTTEAYGKYEIAGAKPFFPIRDLGSCDLMYRALV